MLHGDMTLTTKLFLLLRSHIFVNAMAGRAGKPFAKHRIDTDVFHFRVWMMTFRTKLSCLIRIIAGRVKDVIPGRIVDMDLAAFMAVDAPNVSIRHSCQIPYLTCRFGLRYFELVMTCKAGLVLDRSL